VTQDETRIFHYDTFGHLIAETDENGMTLAEYIYLGDQPLAMIDADNSTYYFHNDHLGTPQMLTNQTKGVVWKTGYGAFGEVNILIENIENPFRFPGQYYDKETGLHYNYFRYYYPKVGRYLTPDPIGLEGGINLYAYAANNPIRFTDPDGRAVMVLPALAACLASPPCAAALAALTAATLYYAQKATYETLDLLSKQSWPWTRENTIETVGKTEDFCEYPSFKPDPGEKFRMCLSFCKAAWSRNFMKRMMCYAACGWGGILESMGGMKIGK
jgi:RHS repeat-associated protein